MHYVYVLISDTTGKLYKGLTRDLRVRLDKHNNGNVKSTKPGVPWRLIYYQAFLNKTDARREEIFLKTGKGRERLDNLLKNTLNN
jgi:putative endonuclease